MEQGPGSRGASGAAAASPHLTDAPLQRPTLRVQDGDIILEEAEPSSASAVLATPDVRALSFPRTPGAGASPATPVPTLDLSQLRQYSSRKTTQTQGTQDNVGSRSRSTLRPTPEPIKTAGNGIGSFR